METIKKQNKTNVHEKPISLQITKFETAGVKKNKKQKPECDINKMGVFVASAFSCGGCHFFISCDETVLYLILSMCISQIEHG